MTNNRYYSGYGIESGPTGQTGLEVTFDENNVIKQGEVILERDKNAKNHMHVVEVGLGNNLRAGLFRK